jgi:hypothetical protein
MSFLSAFTNQLVAFFEALTETIPEERSIKMAVEAVKGVKRVNPRLLMALFHEHFYVPLNTAIVDKNVAAVIAYAHDHVTSGRFQNELMPALAIFDKHWGTLSEPTQEAIWKYLKVLCVLCERDMGIST